MRILVAILLFMAVALRAVSRVTLPVLSALLVMFTQQVVDAVL